MLSSQLISGKTVIGPSALAARQKFQEHDTVTVESLNAKISSILLTDKFIKATTNGNFYWLKLGVAPADPARTLKALKKGLLAAGWSHVSFNIWQKELSVCLWDRPYGGDTNSHLEGKLLSV